jgi:hypothetical protein
VALDSWADPPTVWIAGGGPRWEDRAILMLTEKDGKLAVSRDFGSEAKKAVTRLRPPALGRQRLWFNPDDGKLYVGEAEAGVGKPFSRVLVIDPRNGRVRERTMPFDAEDMCFDRDGLVYLRTGKPVARYRARRPAPHALGRWRRVRAVPRRVS